MLRLQPGELVAAERGHEVDPHGVRVGVVRVLADGRRRDDVVQPVVQPVLDGPDLAGLPDLALVALALKALELLRDLVLGLAAAVPAVRAPVVLDADGDVAVPGTVRAALEDAGAAVGVAGALLLAGHRSPSRGRVAAGVPRGDEPGGERRDGVDVNAAEPANSDGFEFAGHDERVGLGLAQSETFGSFLDGEENAGRRRRWLVPRGCFGSAGRVTTGKVTSLDDCRKVARRYNISLRAATVRFDQRRSR